MNRINQEGSLAYGMMSLAGRKRYMEDSVKVAPKHVDEYDLFAVYDGHGGCFVSNSCKERLHMLIAEEKNKPENGGDWEKVMKASFKKLDDDLRMNAGIETVGSSALVVMVGMNNIVVANCGNSRAVLCRGGVPVPLSLDHKPNRPDEKARVEAAGGLVFEKNGSWNVMGVLPTSRAIGFTQLTPYVIPEPEVSIFERTEEDEFLIIASPGLWSAITNEFACEVVKMGIDARARVTPSGEATGNIVSEGPSAGEMTLARAAIVLVELAIARGSSDNISVIIVQIKA